MAMASFALSRATILGRVRYPRRSLAAALFSRNPPTPPPAPTLGAPGTPFTPTSSLLSLLADKDRELRSARADLMACRRGWEAVRAELQSVRAEATRQERLKTPAPAPAPAPPELEFRRMLSVPVAVLAFLTWLDHYFYTCRSLHMYGIPTGLVASGAGLLSTAVLLFACFSWFGKVFTREKILCITFIPLVILILLHVELTYDPLVKFVVQVFSDRRAGP